MTITPASIVNQALAEIAGQYTVTGTPPTFDGSNAGIAAGTLYQPAVQSLLRAQDYEFSRVNAQLALSATPAALYPWFYAYAYPADCLRIRQVIPATWDPNDPYPVRWEEGTYLSNPPSRVIFCNEPTAGIVYTSSTVTEAQWDALFAESFVRYLGSMLAMALGGRMDLARKMLEDSGQFAQIGMDRDS